ncbi:unnamed protein product [Pocillopora meandrina]|uniref:Reverse transcriptase N-terminal domain-containing protein n=1 Tax=Pocillopora meandrina TaxID=46732 RepID=A0AAU9VTG0_9CNID|nr:unnamed protein product [Pocillopora meandrina]
MSVFQTSYRKARDKLLTKAKKSGSDNDWLNFRHAKNNVNNLIGQTKQAYFKSKFSENRQDSRKLWNLIKFLSGSDNHDCGLQRLVDNDGTTSNKVEIAETLNSFFLTQKNNLNPQSELKNDLRCQPKQAPSPTLYQVSGTLNLPQISKERVVDLLLSVPLHKATGDDDLDDLSQWSAANTMVTNAAKTKCLVVTRKRLINKIVASSLNLHLGNSNIEH